jgi:gas vesicle protein
MSGSAAGAIVAGIIGAIVSAATTTVTTVVSNKEKRKAQEEARMLNDEEKRIGLQRWNKEFSLAKDSSAMKRDELAMYQRKYDQEHARLVSDMSYTRLKDGAQYFKELLSNNIGLQGKISSISSRGGV